MDEVRLGRFERRMIEMIRGSKLDDSDSIADLSQKNFGMDVTIEHLTVRRLLCW